MGLQRARARDHNKFRDLEKLPNLADGWNEPQQRRDVPWGAALVSLLGLTAAIVGARVLQGPAGGDPGVTSATVAGAQLPTDLTGEAGDPQNGAAAPVVTSGTATLVPVTPLTTAASPTAVPAAVSPTSASPRSASPPPLPQISSSAPFSATATPTPSRSPKPPVAATGCSVTYSFASIWNSGFVLNMVLTNTSSSTWQNWSGAIQTPAGVTVQSSWNSTMQGSGSGTISMSSAAWNATVAPGTSIKVGFQGNISDSSQARVSQISVQGSTCTVG